MTLVVNLYGGPGTGKSTTAAALFAQLKSRGHNAELLQEVAKEWAWEGRRIRPVDQFHLFGQQSAREARLWNKASVVVTDSPLRLGVFFSRHFKADRIAAVLEGAVAAFEAEGAEVGVRYHHHILTRSKPYNPAGRYQTEDEARDMDAPIEALVRASVKVPETVTVGSTDAVFALADMLERWWL